MKKVILVSLFGSLIIGITLIMLLIDKKPSTQFTVDNKVDNKIKKVLINTDKTYYSNAEQILFSIQNNTDYTIYFFPNTCASELVKVYKLDKNRKTLVSGSTKVCMLAPSVTRLLPNQSLKGEIKEDVQKHLTSGKYILKFTYSYKSNSKFAIGEQESVESKVFTIKY